jgi:hypothetical protein
MAQADALIDQALIGLRDALIDVREVFCLLLDRLSDFGAPSSALRPRSHWHRRNPAPLPSQFAAAVITNKYDARNCFVIDAGF